MPYNDQKVSVVIPAFEEEQSIGGVVKELLSFPFVDEVVVVDDGSSDATQSIAKEAGAKVLTHPYNIGNGAAVKSGIRHATGEIVVLMDGDGQHKPTDLEKLLKGIDSFSMVVGSRDRAGQASVFRLGANFIYNCLASYVTKSKILDLTSGFRVLRRKTILKFLYLLPNTFSYPSTITLALLRSGYPIKFTSIDVQKRKGKSKIRLIRDGARFFLIILKITMLFSPLRIFLPVSVLLVLMGLTNYIYTFFIYHRFTNMSALLMMTGVLVFMLGLVAEQIAMLRMDRTEDD